jgi:hypothetical protein
VTGTVHDCPIAHCPLVFSDAELVAMVAALHYWHANAPPSVHALSDTELDSLCMKLAWEG